MQDIVRERGIHSLAVTSALPGEGKTTAAVNLALVSAMSVGRRVLLVDCDLRRPKVHQSLGLRVDAGLSELLEGQATAAERAAALDPDAATTEHALGNVARAQFHYADAERHYLRAMELDPSYSDVREDYSEVLHEVARLEDSMRAARQLVTLDPYFGTGWVRLLNTSIVGSEPGDTHAVDHAPAVPAEPDGDPRHGRAGCRRWQQAPQGNLAPRDTGRR